MGLARAHITHHTKKQLQSVPWGGGGGGGVTLVIIPSDLQPARRWVEKAGLDWEPVWSPQGSGSGG